MLHANTIIPAPRADRRGSTAFDQRPGAIAQRRVAVVSGRPASTDRITWEIRRHLNHTAVTVMTGLERLWATAVSDHHGFDLVLIDATLPGFDPIATLGRLRHEMPDAIVIVLVHATTRDHVVRLLQCGASAVIPLSLRDRGFHAAIDLAMAGERFAPAELLVDLDRTDSIGEGESEITLSPREMEVASYLAQGLSNKEIARRLGLQEVTIKVYATAIFRKLGVRNRTQAAARLLAEGIV